MEKFNKYLSKAVCCVILLILPAFINVGQAVGAPAPANVNVVNTPDVNVVNNPGVTVLNSPTVQSQQSGTWNVGITGSPTVTVGNTNANPVPVVAIPPSPFQEEVILVFNSGDSGAFQPFQVPAGKRLVIEHVSARAALTEGQQLTETSIETLQVGGGSVIKHYFVASFQASVPGVADYYAISQQTRLYAVGGVQVRAFRSNTTGTAQMNISVSGYLVDQ
jgi:hypothetical protein